jgi:hypothetical protein
VFDTSGNNSRWSNFARGRCRAGGRRCSIPTAFGELTAHSTEQCGNLHDERLARRAAALLRTGFAHSSLLVTLNMAPRMATYLDARFL